MLRMYRMLRMYIRYIRSECRILTFGPNTECLRMPNVDFLTNAECLRMPNVDFFTNAECYECRMLIFYECRMLILLRMSNVTNVSNARMFTFLPAMVWIVYFFGAYLRKFEVQILRDVQAVTTEVIEKSGFLAKWSGWRLCYMLGRIQDGITNEYFELSSKPYLSHKLPSGLDK